MEYVSTDLLKDGHTVAKDVHSSTHMLLIPAGSTLNTSKIQLLKTWRITRIFIKESLEENSAEDSQLKAQLQTKIDTLFLHNEDNDFIKSLKLAARRFHRRNSRGQE